MGRVIKNFGYVEKIKDTVECHASEIAKLQLVSLVYRISKDYQEKSILVTLRATAPEEGTGLVTITWSNEITNGSIEVDEIEFVEGIFEAIVDYEGDTWMSSNIYRFYQEIHRAVVADLISQGFWVYSQKDDKWYNEPLEV